MGERSNRCGLDGDIPTPPVLNTPSDDDVGGQRRRLRKIDAAPRDGLGGSK
jgi:hypothetical protein